MNQVLSVISQVNHSVSPVHDQLPEAWIDRLFARLSSMYGTKLSDLWRGSDPHEVKAVWAEKLAGFYDMPDCIKNALDACDDKPWPPTLPEFIALCRASAQRKGPTKTPLLECIPDPEYAKAKIAEVVSNWKKDGSYDFKGWANEFRRRYLAGDHLLPIQIMNASAALNETWANRQCNPRKEAA